MTGKTVRSSVKQSPIYSMRPKTLNGAFYEDLAKVTNLKVHIHVYDNEPSRKYDWFEIFKNLMTDITGMYKLS